LNNKNKVTIKVTMGMAIITKTTGTRMTTAIRITIGMTTTRNKKCAVH
jgi:hypothetical protein